jgi:hypothetical protein
MINFPAQSRFAILSFTLLALIALTVNGCQSEKQAGPPEKITIAYTESTDPALVHIAMAILINSTFIGRTVMKRVTALHEVFKIIGGAKEVIL